MADKQTALDAYTVRVESDMATVWTGSVPDKCDTCGAPIDGEFYDAATKMGPGRGRVGPGRGQKYEKQADGRWLKTEG